MKYVFMYLIVVSVILLFNAGSHKKKSLEDDNMVIEVGRLVYDVKVDKVKVGGNEKSVLNNRIAISSGKDKSIFIDIVAWGGTADLIGKYFKKGYEIYVEGHLINTKKKKDNVEFDAIALNIDNFKFTNGNPKDSGEEPPFLS